jgi:cell division protein FtsB
MMHKLTNLLPKERERSLRQTYFLRLVTVGVLLLGGIVAVHGVFLLPTYLYLQDEVAEQKETLATLATAVDDSEQKQVGARVKSLADDSAYLAKLASIPKASASVAAVLALPRDGILLSGFSFAPTKDGAVMNLSGTAPTREALRRFEQSLKGAPFITGVDLPISAYAKERDIDFTVALSGPFLP